MGDLRHYSSPPRALCQSLQPGPNILQGYSSQFRIIAALDSQTYHNRSGAVSRRPDGRSARDPQSAN